MKTSLYPSRRAQTSTAKVWLLAVHDNRPPLPALCQHFGIEPAIALAWIAQTQKAGLLPATPLVGHWPRSARWSQPSPDPWMACGTCRRPWPCTEASTITWLERVLEAETDRAAS